MIYKADTAIQYYYIKKLILSKFNTRNQGKTLPTQQFTMTQPRLSKREKRRTYQQAEADAFYRYRLLYPLWGFLTLTSGAALLLGWFIFFTTPWNARLIAIVSLAAVWCLLCLRVTWRYYRIGWLHWQDLLPAESRHPRYLPHTNRIDPTYAPILYFGSIILLITGNLVIEFWNATYVPFPFWIWSLLLLELGLTLYLMTEYLERFDQEWLINESAYKREKRVNYSTTSQTTDRTHPPHKPSPALRALTQFGFPLRSIVALHKAQTHFDLSDHDLLNSIQRTYTVITIASTQTPNSKQAVALATQGTKTILRTCDTSLYPQKYEHDIAFKQMWNKWQWLLHPYGNERDKSPLLTSILIGNIILHTASRHKIHWPENIESAVMKGL